MQTRILLLCGLAVACLSLVSRAEAGHGSYGGWGGPLSSTSQMVARVKEDKVELWGAVARRVPETHTRTVQFEVDGQKVQKEEMYTVFSTVTELFMRQENLDKVKAFDAARKPIKAGRLAKLLEEGRPVLVCESGEKVDGVYLKLVRPETVVLMLPQPEPVMYMQAAPTLPPAPGEIAPAEPQPPAPVNENGDPTAFEASSPQPAALPVDQPTLPQGGAPSAEQAALTKEGRIRLRTVSNVSSETTANYWHSADGTERQPAQTTIRRTYRQEASQEFDPATVRGLTAAGAEIPSDELARRLAQETPVLVSGDGREIDIEYLKIIREDALILLVPTVDPPAFMAPEMMPAEIQPAPTEATPVNAPPRT